MASPHPSIVPGEAEAIGRVVRGYLAATAVVVAVVTGLSFLSPGSTQMSPVARLVGAGALLALQVTGVRVDWARRLLSGRGQLAIDGIVLGLTVVTSVQPMLSGPDAMTAWGLAVTVVFAGVVASNRGMVLVLATVLGTAGVAIVRFADVVEPVVPITTTVLIVVLGCLSWFAGRSFRASMRAHHAVTEELREHTREQQRQQDRTIEELRRLEALREDFVSTVSHELRTPLTVIRGLATTLAREEVVADAVLMRDIVARVERNAVGLQELIGRLLDFDRLRQPEQDAARTSADAGLAVALGIGAVDLGDHPLTTDVAPLPRVVGTEPLVSRIVAELVGNAVTHTDPTTPIRVTARVVADGVRVTVADEGSGVDEQAWAELTGAFRRGGRHEIRETRGLGLGLAFCERALMVLGSTLERDDVPVGTSASFTLPASLVPPDAGTPPRGAALRQAVG